MWYVWKLLVAFGFHSYQITEQSEYYSEDRTPSYKFLALFFFKLYLVLSFVPCLSLEDGG